MKLEEHTYVGLLIIGVCLLLFGGDAKVGVLTAYGQDQCQE